MSRLDEPRSADDEGLKSLPKQGRLSSADAGSRGFFKDMTAEGCQTLRRMFEKDQNSRMLTPAQWRRRPAGTDCGELAYRYPGFSLHDELALLVES
jgi:hypothetical protein